MEENKEEVKEEKKEEKKTNHFKKIIEFLSKKHILSNALIILIAIGLILLFGSKFNLISFNTNTNTRETTLQYEFKDVGELVTQEMYLREIEDTSKNKDINGWVVPFTTSREIFSIDVEILASVDFSQITFSIDSDNKSFLIKLPHSKIYKSYMVDNSLKVYYDQGNIFTSISHEDQSQLESKLVEKGLTEAEEKGLLDKADENAKTIIENMIKGYSDFEDYTVDFQYTY